MGIVSHIDGLAAGLAAMWGGRLAACAVRRVAVMPARALGMSGRHEAPPEVRRAITGRNAVGVRPRCRRCWWRAGTHADHVIPAAWGGPGAGWNLRPLCPRCNMSRGATMSMPEALALAVPGPRDWPAFAVAAVVEVWQAIA